MSEKLEKDLADCLEAIEEGRLSIEQCRERYPEQWEQLRKLLPLASALRQAPPVTPSFHFRRDARRRLISQLTPRSKFAWISQLSSSLSELYKILNLREQKPSLQLLGFLIAFLFLVTGVSAAYASGNALPGDALYPIKTTVEKLQLFLTFDDARATQLQVEFAQKRIGEMKALVEEEQYEDIQIAALNYQSTLIGANESLRALVLDGDQRAKEMGNLVEEALFYDTLILSGLMEAVPGNTKGHIEVAIGASKSGNAIARQWVELYSSSPSGATVPLPETTQINEDFGIPLPTDIACWPNNLVADPPEGIPICEEEQTPVPLPENLILFCWPPGIPFDPPEGIPLCEEGQAPVPLPDNLNLICWPRVLPYDPPEGLPICQPRQLPVPLPEREISCWPSRIPYDAPEGIPPCESGPYPTPNPAELPCWPPELPSDPPPGLPLCEPRERPALPNNFDFRDILPGVR